MKAKTQQEQFREKVIAEELIVRNLKAEYEKMYYWMACNDIAPKFQAAWAASKAPVIDGPQEDVVENEEVATEA